MGEKLEIFDDHSSSKIRNLVDEEIRICRSYPFRHRTTRHCAERRAQGGVAW